MENVILGIEKVDYISQKTGRQVKGYTIYSGFTGKKTLFGHSIEKTYIPESIMLDCGYHEDVFDELNFGSSIVKFAYNKFGGVETIEFIK